MPGENKLYSLSELLEKEINSNSKCYHQLIIYSKDKCFQDLKHMIYINMIVLIIHRYLINNYWNDWNHDLIYIGLYIWYPFTLIALGIYLYYWYYDYIYNCSIIHLLSFPNKDDFNYYGILVDENINYTLNQWDISNNNIQLWYKEKVFEEEFILKLQNSSGPHVGEITKKSWQSLSYIANNNEKNILTEFLISLIEYNSSYKVYLLRDKL